MKRRRAAPHPAAEEGIPACLQAGPCIEVWAPDIADPTAASFAARRRWRAAADRWLAQAGIVRTDWASHPEALRRGGQPWSYTFIAGRDPERLAGYLEVRKLPPDWQPTPAPAEWRA